MGYKKDIFGIFAYEFERSHKNEIFGFASDEIKSSFSPDEVGFHHEVISSTAGGFIPSDRTDFFWLLRTV